MSRYQATDFTGQRSAFFAHNFVVPASRSEEIVQNYGDWLHADFARSYDGELGGTLPELSDIPVIRTDRRPDPIAGLRLLGINEGIFKALLQAVMLSVAGKKKSILPLMYLSRSCPHVRWSLQRFYIACCRMNSAVD